MRRTTTLATTALLLLTACGTGTQAGDESGDTVSPSPSPSTSPSACSSPGELHADDSGRTVCLSQGGTLRISLDGSKTRPWKTITADGTALEAGNSGIVVLPGDANAAYTATTAGTVRLTSSRPLCATEPGKVSCKGIQEWWVKVVVK